MVKDVDQKFADIRDSLLNTLQKVESILNDSQTINLDEYLEKKFEKQNNRNRYNILAVCDGDSFNLYSYSLDTKEELLSILKKLLTWYTSIKGLQIVNLETGGVYWLNNETEVTEFVEFLEDGVL